MRNPLNVWDIFKMGNHSNNINFYRITSFFFFNIELRLCFLVILNDGRVNKVNLLRKKQQRYVSMPKEFDMIQRKMVFLTFLVTFYISFLNFYQYNVT